MANQFNEINIAKVKKLIYFTIILLSLSSVFNVVQYVASCKLNNKVNEIKEKHEQLELAAKKLDEKVNRLDNQATTMK